MDLCIVSTWFFSKFQSVAIIRVVSGLLVDDFSSTACSTFVQPKAGGDIANIREFPWLPIVVLLEGRKDKQRYIYFVFSHINMPLL